MSLTRVLAGAGKSFSRAIDLGSYCWALDNAPAFVQRKASCAAGAGLRDEEDIFASVLPASRGRLIWLGINLVTAFVAGLVVQRFEGTIAKVAALAALMPIVASMGGIAGTQTVTLIIRGIALGQVEWRDTRWLLMREVGVSLLTGSAIATIVGVVTVFLAGTWKIAVIIAAAHGHQPLAAAMVGVLVSTDPAENARGSGAVRRCGADHFHRCHRLLGVARAWRAVPDLVPGPQPHKHLQVAGVCAAGPGQSRRSSEPMDPCHANVGREFAPDLVAQPQAQLQIRET